MPIKNGAQYIASIDRLKPAILLKGERLQGKISGHAAFHGLLATQAALYDMQGEEAYRDRMTYLSPTTGDPVGLSFLSPATKRDLRRRRDMMALWSDRHHGFLGRSPDYMNTALMAYASAAAVLGRVNPEYADNLQKYYEFCREHDITLSHAFSLPAGSRISSWMDAYEDTAGAKVHEWNRDGMRVSGAFLLATQAATSEEILIFPPLIATPDTEPSRTFAFALPIDTPGLTYVCRESYVEGDSASDYPLSSKFEEMDALVICRQAWVPRDRIFWYGDIDTAQEFLSESRFHALVGHQALCRYIAKTEFFLGAAEGLANIIGIRSDSVQEQVSEIMAALEILKALLVHAEGNARLNRWGVMVPDRAPLLTANRVFPRIYPHMMEIIRDLAGSGLVMIPSEADIEAAGKNDLDRILGVPGMDAKEVVAVNRLAWELSASSFAGRQAQYERFFFGSPPTVAKRLYDGYPGKEQAWAKVARFLRGEAEFEQA